MLRMREIGVNKVHPLVFERFAKLQLRKLKSEHEQTILARKRSEQRIVRGGKPQKSVRAVVSNVLGDKASVDELAHHFGTLFLHTFTRNLFLIEGYLAKEIDAKGLLRRTKRHLRYFRLIFSSGKLCIKEDQADVQMRSFLLQDLR